MALNHSGGLAEGVPDRRQHPIRGVERSLERCGLASEGGALMANAFDQLAALSMEINQASAHDRWLP
jgi:hypothetical protein